MSTTETLSVAGVVLSLIAWLVKLTWMFAQLSIQVHTMWEKHMATWEFLAQRGLVEVEQRGLGKRRSPLSIDESPKKHLILQLYEPLLPEIEKIVDSTGGDINNESDEVKLCEAIGTKLGKDLFHTVCRQLDVHEGGCVVLALAVLRHKRARNR